jgi:hypothetical protein
VDASALLAIMLDEPDAEFYPFEDSGRDCGADPSGDLVGGPGAHAKSLWRGRRKEIGGMDE